MKRKQKRKLRNWWYKATDFFVCDLKVYWMARHIYWYTLKEGFKEKWRGAP